MYQSTPHIQETPTGLVVSRYGCIRLGVDNEWSRPYWHWNSTHATLGFDRYSNYTPVIELENDDLVVRGTPVRAGEEVLSINANVDESMAAKRVFAAGASGGGLKMRILLYRMDVSNGTAVSTKVSPRSATFAGDYSNIWLRVDSFIPNA